MKKDYLKRLFIFALALTSISLFAQNRQIIVGKEYTDKNKVTFVTEKQNSATLKFDINELNLIEIDTEYGKMYKMESDKAPLLLEAGKPELIYLPAAIIIPETGSTELQFIYGDYKEIKNVEIAPSKGSLSRNVDPATVPYQKGEIYEIDDFFPGTGAMANDPFIMRDVRGQSIFAYPVQYNPVTKTLRIYSEITVTANYTQKRGINEFTSSKRHKTIEPEFNSMYSNLFLNFSTIQQKNYPTGEEGELLIICHPEYVAAMKPYIDWKRTIGRKTTIVTTSETGTTAVEIKNYVTNFYNNPENNLAYILLVGDFAHVPPHTYWNSGTLPLASDYTLLTDNFYGQIVGDDMFMDVLVGRMSAETIAHVQTQVQRTIYYERDLTTADSWISSAIGIATNEGSNGHDGNEIDYEHINNIRTRLLNYGYNPVYQEYGKNAGVPQTSAEKISQRFNDGVSVANYCNHGSQLGWTMSGGPSYTDFEVNALKNTGKFPFIFSVACLNGRFDYGVPCFAEAWLRATHNDQPAGAVATIMATINLKWAPPMTAQDEFANICIEIPSPYEGGQPGIKKTFAGAAINATQKMLLVHGYGNYNIDNVEDFDAWTVFGDPTLMIRTKTPQSMKVEHFPVLLFGADSFPVECDANGGLAVISRIDENEEVIILGKGIVENGNVEIILDEPVITTGNLTLTITGKDYETFQSVIIVNPADQPNIVMLTYDITGDTDFGKTVGINFELTNVANAPYTADNVSVKVTTESSFVSVPEMPINLGYIEAGKLYFYEDEIFVTLTEDVPNNELILLKFFITFEYENEEYVWESDVKFNAFAPILDISEIYIENTNGARIDRFTPNATHNLVITFSNKGYTDLNNLNIAVSVASNYLNIADNSTVIETIEKENIVTYKFLINVGNAPEGMPASVVVRASSGIFTKNKIYTNAIGKTLDYFMSEGTISTSFAHFYDAGGPNSAYYSGENYKITFMPINPDKKLKVSFSSFDVEENNDNLFVYNGTQAFSSLLLATLTGSKLPQDIEATNEQGALTFMFKSNSEIQNAGWAAVVHEMEKYYNVSFVITDENNNPVTDAIITFDGYKLAKNQFSVPLVATGEYSYSVEKEGYSMYKEKVTIVNDDEELKIQLSTSSIEKNNLSEYYIYPNPFNDIIYIGGNSTLINKVYISNLLGQKVKEIDINGKSSFSTENLPQGIYMITFERNDGKIETVKMIKK